MTLKYPNGAAAMLICPADGPFGEIALGTVAMRL